MKRILLTLVFLAAGMIRPASAVWQWWNEVEAKYKLPGVKLILKSEQKFTDDLTMYLYNIVPGVDIPCREWMSVGINYKFESEDSGDEWLDEHRLEVQPTLKWKMGHIKFTDRNRVEYRMFDHKDNSFRYRNRIKAGISADVGAIALGFYLCDEMFYDFDASEFNQNRAAIGVNGKLIGLLSADIAYLYKSKKSSGDWSNTNVVVTKINLPF